MTSALLLDEMYPPLLAAGLRDRGHDVVAVADLPAARGLPDEQVLEFALDERRCLLTENIRDFEILRRGRLADGKTCCGLLYCSGGRYPRTKNAIGSLLTALDARLAAPNLPGPSQVDWLS